MNARLTIAAAALVLASGTAGVLTAELVEPVSSEASTVAPTIATATPTPLYVPSLHSLSAETHRILTQAMATNPTSECVAEWNEEQSDHEVICSAR